MDVLMIYIGIAISALIALIILYKWTNLKKSKEDQNEQQRPIRNDQQAPARVQNARARMRIAQNRQVQPQQANERHSDSEIDEDEGIALPSGKIGKKKLAKLQMKADKRAKRETEEREREEKKKEEERLREIRREKELKEEEEEKQKEEEERLRKEEQARREQEEYEMLKASFAVEEEGFDENKDEFSNENMIQEFIDYIKNSKVVILEEVAALYKLKTQSVIDRIKVLLEKGRLTGVIDDRGKFIYISHEELLSVAKFIHQRGRVSLSDIAEASNQLINLGSDLPLQC